MHQITPARFRRLALLALALAADGRAGENHVYEYQGQRYPYTVEQTGENHTFEFERNPGPESGRRRAAMHVFQSVYGDYSIKPGYVDAFMKEGAMCFVFDGDLYSYRACFLPNDFSVARHQFWGFVSRVPNVKWFLTRQIGPGLLGLGLLFWGVGRLGRRTG